VHGGRKQTHFPKAQRVALQGHLGRGADEHQECCLQPQGTD